MAEQSLKSKTFSGVVWSAVNRFAQQGIAFVFNILIARKLMPSDYGAIAMLGIFLALSYTFINSGFANALIRKKDRTENDYNTVFYFNVVISIVCYLILFFSAPAIARFYNLPILTSITRVVALTLLIDAFTAIQTTELTIRIDFKTKARVSVISSLLAGLISLYLAGNGLGVWALVWQQIASSTFGLIFYWFSVKWRPKLIFSWKSFKDMFSYGSKLLASSLLSTIYSNLSTIIVGKVYTSGDLGEYSKAQSFAGFPSSAITSIMQSVTFPVLASIQDQKERLERYYKQFINLSAFVIFPVMIGLAAVARPLITLLLKEQWLGMVPYLQIICLGSMWYPVHAINLNLLQVLGRSDYFLKLEIWKKAIGLVILIVTVPIGIIPMCIGQVVSSLIALFINTYYTKRLIGYGFWDQMKNLTHILLHSLVMGAIVLVIVRVLDGVWLQLICGVLAGIAYYFVGSYLFKFPELNELLTIAKEQIGRYIGRTKDV